LLEAAMYGITALYKFCITIIITIKLNRDLKPTKENVEIK